MTLTSQTSQMKTRNTYRRWNSNNIWMVIINAEDGNYQEHEIEASSYNEAEAKAEAIAQDSMVDVTFIEIYKNY